MSQQSTSATANSLASSKRASASIRAFFLMFAAGWTISIGISIWYNTNNLETRARDSAKIQATTAFEKDVIYRRWSSIHGGVFVAADDDKIQPNPYLAPEGREITDAAGKIYTKVNPAFMTRLVHEIGETRSGVRGHITSNTPIRPANAPDPWESKALTVLETKTVSEVSQIVLMDDKPYMRYIGALITEPSCLSCHAFQGYKEGDVRGGISVSVPMEPFYAAMRTSEHAVWVTHGTLWVIGLIGISFGTGRLAQRSRERDEAEGHLRQLTRKLEVRVTERTAELKARQRELLAFINNVDAGVFLKATDGVYSFANIRFASMFNLVPDTLVGRANADIFPSYLAAALDEAEARVLSEVRGAVYRYTRDDLARSYSYFIFPIVEENVAVGIGGLIVDTTERDQAEKDLQAAKETAERANRAKSDFLANMSHEIRTPLNGVIGMADILLRTQLSREQAAMAAAVKNSGDVLLLVLNDILDLAKIESGKLELELKPFQLRDALYASIRAVIHTAYQKGLELILDIDDAVPEHLTGDATRIRQVLLNLVNNALKFTEEGEVRITVRLLSRDATSAEVLFMVSDTGIGIAEDKQQSVFNAFEQADNSITRKYGGTGLGLAICTGFLETMNSSLRLESVEGQGSCFSFTLHLPVNAGPKFSEPLPSLAGKTILIADNNREAVELLRSSLGKAGAAVDAVTTTAEVEAAAGKHYDALILGQRFPENHRFILDRMGTAADQRHTTFVYLLTEGLLLDETQDGFQGLFDKPVRPDLLIRALADGFNEARDRTGVPAAETLLSTVSRNILLVEDVPLNRMVATHMLTELGHTVTEACHGLEALQLIEKQSFDFVFMDIQMPVMDGITATRKLREWERLHPDRPVNVIIAMTANALKGDRETCIAAGMDDYVSKPFNLDDIKAVLAKNFDTTR